MRQLFEQPPPEPFTAKRLVHPPLVYLWIPVGIISLVLFVLVVRCCFKRPRRFGALSLPLRVKRRRFMLP